MSRNVSGAAIKRDDATFGEAPPQSVTVQRQDLADLAAALLRAEALVAANVTPEPGGADSIERIADIAFILHERDVEASLCDALDAAVQEISAAGAGKEDRARRARQTAEVLRELSQRVATMIELSEAQHGEPTGTANAIKDDLPRAAVSRGGSLPTPAPAEVASNPPRETAVVAEPVQQTKPRGGQEAAAVNAAHGAAEPLRSAAAVKLPVEPAAEAFLDEDLLLRATANKPAAANKPMSNDVLLSEAPSAGILPSAEPALGSASAAQARGDTPARKATPLLLNPEDDPDDLFEPAAGRPPSASPEAEIDITAPPPAPENAPVSERAGIAAERIMRSDDNAPSPLAAGEVARLGADLSLESSNPLRPLRFAAATVPPSVPRPEPADPLAPIRALSEEETIALFS